MAVQQDEFREHRLRNRLQTIILVVGLVVIAAAIGWSFAGTSGLVILTIGAVIFLAAGRRVGPQMVLRMYKAQPVAERDAPALVAMIRELSEKAGLPSEPALFYIPTEMVNAFATGTRKEAYIGLTDGILRTLTMRELRGVLAHEIMHLKHNDLAVMGLADVAARATHTVSQIGKLLLFINLPLVLSGESGISWLFIILLILAPTLTSLMQMALSRTREYDADLGAARLTGDPEGLALALQRMERVQGGFFERIFMPGRRIPEPSLLRTHPPIEERVRRLHALEGREDEPPAKDQQILPDIARLPHPTLRKPRWHFFSGIWS